MPVPGAVHQSFPRGNTGKTHFPHFSHFLAVMYVYLTKWENGAQVVAMKLLAQSAMTFLFFLFVH